MKWLIVAGLMLAVLRFAGAAEENFTSSVSPDDLTATGLAGLTPAQLARLNALVDAYKSGALANARRAAVEALAAKQAAEAQAARAEMKAEVVRQDAARAETARIETAKAEAVKADAARAEAAKAEAAKAEKARAMPAPGAPLPKKGLLKPTTQAETLAVESSIPGKFRGWEPRQVFTLANGQRWQVANTESYYTPVIENPKVQIVPAAIAGYWLRFPDLGTQVRATLLGDK